MGGKKPSCLQTDNDSDYAPAWRSVTIILNLLNAAMKCIIHSYLTGAITEYKWIQRAFPLFMINKGWINVLLNDSALLSSHHGQFFFPLQLSKKFVRIKRLSLERSETKLTFVPGWLVVTKLASNYKRFDQVWPTTTSSLRPCDVKRTNCVYAREMFFTLTLEGF